jgi:class 3 adenylate cyclase
VRDLCRGKDFRFDDQREATPKGFPDPVRLFVVNPTTTGTTT